MIDEPADSSAPSTPPVSEERLIRNARDFLTPSSSNLNNNSNTLNTDRPEEQVDSPNNSPPTTVGMTTDAEDLDLSHLLSDLDDILTVQVSDEEFLHRNQSTEQTDTDYEDDNISTGTRQPTVDGPQSGSMPSVQSVPSDEDGIKPLSSNNQQRLQEYHSTPNPTVATESSTTTSSPHENGGREGTTPTSPAAIMEKENLLRELEDLRMDRDYLEQQLVETRNELDTARTSLQKNIYDLEHELRSIRENTQRLNESRENEALEMELFELAQMAREQEEKELAAKKNAEQRALQQSSFSTRKPNVAIGKTGLDTKNDSEPKLNPNSASCNDGTVSHGHSNQFYQDKIKSLEEMLSKREFREQLLEKEIRDLQRKAQVESQKFRETQRQVAWFQEELLAMNEDQEDDNGNSDNDGGSKEPLGIIPEDDDTSEDDDTNGLSREDTRISDSKRESPSRESKRIRLLQQQRLDLEHRVTDLLDEVGTLKVEQGQLQHEHRQQDSLLQQLRQEMKQQKEQYRMGDMLLQRQVKEWQERADSLQKQLKREQNASQELRHARRKEGLLWRRQVEELEKRIKDFEDTMEREKEKMWHERRLHEQVVTDLESRLGTLRSSASCSSSERHKVDRAEDANIGTSTTVCSDEGCIPSPPSVSLLLKDAEDEIQKLKHQIHQIEGELSQSRHSESRLLFQLTKMEKQLEATQGEIGKLTERVTVLQTFLDISLNGSPSRQKSMREEYASYLEASPIAPYNPSSNRGRDDKNLQKSRKISSESRPRHVKIKDQDVSSECSSVLSCTGASICSLSRSELSQQSILQDMQLKLDHELVKLKVRKDKLRRNSASSQNMGDSVRKYRSLLVSCADGNSLNSHDERAANEERSTPKEETSLAFCFDSKIVKRGFASSSKSSQGDSISRHLANDNDDSALKLKALELEKEALEVVLANTEEKITSLAKAKADYEKREMEWEKEQQHLHETISSLNLQIMIDEENKTRSLLQADLKESQCKLLAEKETIESELASLRERYSDLETHSSSDATKIKDMEQQLDDAANQRMIHKGIVTALQSASLEKEQKLLHLENQISNLKKSSNNLEEQNIQLQAQIEELKKILSNTNDQLTTVTIASKEQLENNQQRLKDLEAEVTALNNELSSMSDERLKISLELQQSQASVEDSRRHVEELQTEINALQASKENLEGLICKKDQEINSIEGELSQSIDELNNLKTVLQSKDVDINRLADEDLSVTIMSKGQLEYNQQRLKDLEAEVTALNNELSSMSDERLKISLELQQSQASVEDSRRHVEELQTEIKALQASKENLEDLICKKDQEINSIEGELSQSIDELNNLKTVLQSKDVDINRLEEERLVHEEFSSRNLFLEREVLECDRRLSQVLAQSEEVTTDLSMNHVAISSFEEKSRTQDSQMAELPLRLSRMTEEMANRSADSDRECADLKKILKEVEEQLLEETTLRKKLSSQIELREMRLSETSNHLSDMEMLLQERTAEVETLKLQMREMELEAEKKDSLIEKKEERLSQASQALSEIEESLHEKENQLHFQEQRLLQASTALSEMEEILEEKECQGKIQDENLMHATLQVATMTEDLSAKEAEMKQKLQQQDTRLVEAASQLGELEKLVLSMTSDVEDRDIKMKALEAVVQRLEAELEQLNAEVETERTEKNRLSADLVEIQQCLSQKETQLDKQLKTVAKLTSQGDIWQLELDDLEGANQILVSKLQAIEEENKRLKHCESDVEVLTNQIVVLKDENSKAAELLAKVQEEREALSNQLIVAKDESSVLLKAIEEQEQRKAAVLQEEAGSELRLLQESYIDPERQCQTLQREGVLHSIDTACQEDCAAAASLADFERVALSAEIKELNEKLDSAKMLAQNRLEELQESSSKFCEERKILAVEVERAKEVLDIHKSKALALETMINELQNENKFLTNELEATRSGKDQRSSLLEKRITDVGSFRMGEIEVLDHLDELQKVKCQCDEERRSLSMKIQALTEENAGITSKVEALEKRESTSAFEYKELQEKYHELKGEMERCTAKTDEESKLLTVKMEASLEALGIASSELETYKERNANLQAAYAELQQQNAELRKKNVVLTDNECSFEAKINQLQYDNRKTVEGLQTKITVLESQKDAITESLNILREEFNNAKSSWQEERYKQNSTQEALQQKMVEAELEFNSQMIHLRDQAGGLQKDFIEVIAERDELLSMMQAIQDENKAAMEEVETMKGRFLSLENEKDLLASELNQLIDVHRALAAQRLKELSDIEKEKEALIDEKQSLQDENNRLSGELHAINLQAGTISKELHDLLDEHKSTVEALQEELSEIRVQREILLAKVGSLEEKVGDLEEKFRNAIKENETLMEELVTVKSQAQEIEVEGEMLSRELSEFSEEYKALAAKREHEIFVLKEERTRLVAQVKQLQDEFEELQQMAEDEEHDQKEFFVSFQKEREELKRERDESIRLSETLRGEVQTLKTQKKELESKITLFTAKIESQFVEIRHLNQSRDELASELEALEGKDMYRRELLSDLSSELNLTASREYKLQLENHELKERSIYEEVTIESLGSRERSVSDEMDDLQKELDDAAVREAMLQCEIVEASGERDAFKEQQNPDGSDNRFETTQEEFLRLIKGEREALLCVQTDMKGQLSLSGEDTVSNTERVGASASKEGASNGHCPVQ